MSDSTANGTSPIFALLLWPCLAGVALYARPLMPIDETRYVAVAWEMWSSGDFLVPHLNGAPYAEKPPLLFWLICGGWSLFGVHEWVPRMISPIAGALNLGLVCLIARSLWPETRDKSGWAAVVLMAIPLFDILGTLVMFDMLLTLFILAANLSMLSAIQHGNKWAWPVAGIALGAALLTKGPVALLYTLPLALAAPWWSLQFCEQWKRHYACVLGTLGISAAIVLAWAIPAADAGGSNYGSAILWAQTAHRVALSADHGEPIWFYLALLPALLFPLFYHRPILQRLHSSVTKNSGLRFIAVWLGAGFVLLSLVSGKQAHYLLPLTPALALLVYRVLEPTFAAPPIVESRPLAVAVLVGLLGVTVTALTFVPSSWLGTSQPNTVPLYPGLLLLAIAGALALRRRVAATGEMTALAGAMVCVIMVLMLGARDFLNPAYDMKPMAARIAALDRVGTLVAYEGNYAGQFSFAARMEHPIPALSTKASILEWCEENPEGFVLYHFRKKNDPYSHAAKHEMAYRGHSIDLLPSRVFVGQLAGREGAE